jgi:hypothetical protein
VVILADYPDWVMAHKKKGMYINHVNGRYYLYAAHSERVPGTSKVRRVSDGYIGRITEEDGLIPTRDKVMGEVIVYEYGLSTVLLNMCSDIHKGLKREFRDASDWILVMGMLSAAFADRSQEAYDWSFLSVKFPGMNMQKVPTAKQSTAIERCERMVIDVMKKTFGEDFEIAKTRLTRISMVKVNEKYYCSQVSENTKEWLFCHKIDWSDLHGKDRANSYCYQGDNKRKQDKPSRREHPQKAYTKAD